MTTIETNILIVTQRLIRNVLVIYFGIVVGLMMIGHRLAADAAGWGIVLILAATAIRVLALIRLFQEAKLRLPTLLGCLLLLLLISTVILRYIQL